MFKLWTGPSCRYHDQGQALAFLHAELGMEIQQNITLAEISNFAG